MPALRSSSRRAAAVCAAVPLGQGPGTTSSHGRSAPLRRTPPAHSFPQEPALTSPSSPRPFSDRPLPALAIPSYTTTIHPTQPTRHGFNRRAPVPLSTPSGPFPAVDYPVYDVPPSNLLGLLPPTQHASLTTFNTGYPPLQQQFGFTSHGFPQPNTQFSQPQYTTPQYFPDPNVPHVEPVTEMAGSYYNMLSQTGAGQAATDNSRAPRFTESLTRLLGVFAEHHRSAAPSQAGDDDLPSFALDDLINDDAFSPAPAAEATVSVTLERTHSTASSLLVNSNWLTSNNLAEFLVDASAHRPSSPAAGTESESPTVLEQSLHGFPEVLNGFVNPSELHGSPSDVDAGVTQFPDEVQSILDSLAPFTLPLPDTEPPPATPGAFVPPPLPDLASTSASRRTKPLPKVRAPAAPKPKPAKRNARARTPLPLDAPIQPRVYLAPSVTSRTDLPAAFAHRVPEEAQAGVKRLLAVSASTALPPAKRVRTAGPVVEVTEEEAAIAASLDPAIETKRLQNTMAARRSRMKKAEYVAGLEAERDAFRARAEEAERLLEESRADVRALKAMLAPV